MKNFLEIIFTIFGLVCCIDIICEKLNNTWIFDFENNYIFIALLLYQALNFINREYTNFKSYFTKLSLFEIIDMLLDVLWYIVVIHVILSWLIGFNIINIHQPLINQFWRGLSQVLDPMYRVIRRFVPYRGAIDFAPLIALIAMFTLLYPS